MSKHPFDDLEAPTTDDVIEVIERATGLSDNTLIYFINRTKAAFSSLTELARGLLSCNTLEDVYLLLQLGTSANKDVGMTIDDVAAGNTLYLAETYVDQQIANLSNQLIIDRHITPGYYTKPYVNEYGTILYAQNLVKQDIPTLDMNQISGLVTTLTNLELYKQSVVPRLTTFLGFNSSGVIRLLQDGSLITDNSVITGTSGITPGTYAGITINDAGIATSARRFYHYDIYDSIPWGKLIDVPYLQPGHINLSSISSANGPGFIYLNFDHTVSIDNSILRNTSEVSWSQLVNIPVQLPGDWMSQVVYYASNTFQPGNTSLFQISNLPLGDGYLRSVNGQIVKTNAVYTSDLPDVVTPNNSFPYITFWNSKGLIVDYRAIQASDIPVINGHTQVSGLGAAAFVDIDVPGGVASYNGVSGTFVTTTQLNAVISGILGTAPTLLDTLQEIDNAINNDPNFATTINTQLSNKQPLNDNLTNLANGNTIQVFMLGLIGSSDLATLWTGLGLGDSASKNVGTTTNTVCAGDDPRITGITAVIDGQIAANDLVTTTTLNTTLLNYVTNTALTTTLVDYVTTVSLSTTLGDYVTAVSLSSQLNNYVTTTTLTTTLSSYVQSTTLSSYYTSLQCDNKFATITSLNNYVTNTSLSTTLSSYATNSSVTTAINNLKANVPTSLDTLYKIASAINNDPNFYSNLTGLLNGKQNNNTNLTNISNAGTIQAFMLSLLVAADLATLWTGLGLGDSASKNVGTTINTVMAGDDSRVTGLSTTYVSNISLSTTLSNYVTQTELNTALNNFTVSGGNLTPKLAAIDTLTWTANQLLLLTGVNTVSVLNIISDIQTFISSIDLPTARNNLGLGSIATHASTEFATAAQGTLANTALQSVHLCKTYTVSGAFNAPITNGPIWYFNYNVNVVNIAIFCSVNPTSNIIVDVLKNGVSIFSGVNPTIGTSQTKGTDITVNVNFTPNDSLAVNVLSGIGTNLCVRIDYTQTG